MGAKISKQYPSYKSKPKVFKLPLNFLFNGPHKNTFGIFEISSFRFLTIFFFENFKFTIVPLMEKLKTSIIWSEIWDPPLTGSISAYMGYLWPCGIQGHLGVIRCTFDFL